MEGSYCRHCKKCYSRVYNYKIHLKNFHPQLYAEENYKEGRKRNCQKCPLCDFSAKFRKNIEKHLKVDHNIEEVSNYKILYFHNGEDFLKWKQSMEKKTKSIFAQYSGSQTVNDVKITYYYCNRSGYFQPKGDGKRALKVNGSTKIDCVCPAKIKKIEKEDGIEVQYLDTHLGHEDTRKSHLYEDEKEKIALKIHQNIPFDKILKELRESSETSVEDLERLTSVTKKDLWNIKSSYKSKIGFADTVTVGEDHEPEELELDEQIIELGN